MNDPGTKQAQDTFPRVIHFDETFGELEIVAQADLLWPCNAYTIAIPSHSKNRLNIFEELILRLTALGNGDTRELAEFTCLGQDIVRFIQNRLSQQGFIDKYFSITSEGKALMEKWETKMPQYATATVYRDSVSGGLLPFVNFQEPSYEQIEKNDGKVIVFYSGATGNPKRFRARIIRGNTQPKEPTAGEVLRAIRQHSRRYRRYASLRGGNQPPPGLIREESAVSIQPKGEPVYLHCRIIVHRGNPDVFLVSDGFGLGYSENFADYLQRQNWKWLTKIKERGIVENLNREEAVDAGQAKQDLNQVRRTVDRWKDRMPVSTNEERQRKTDIDKSITTLYDALEHGFSTLLFEFPVDDWADNYEKGSRDENKRLITGFARSLGFTVTADNAIMLEALPGKIRASREGMVELHPLLALAVTGARYNGAHPVNTLATEFSDFLNFVFDLKKLRDPIRHGNSTVEIKVHELDDLLAKTEKVLRTINPRFSPPGGQQQSAVQKARADYDQLRLKASVELEKVFGIQCLHLMDQNMKGLLYRVEMSSNSVSDVVNDLASLLQTLFHYLQIEQDIFNMPSGLINTKKYILSRLTDAGLIKAGESLPVALDTVNDQRLKNALQGVSMSLQANCVAFLTFCDQEMLHRIAKRTPDILDLVDTIAKLRGHGNNELDMEKKKQNELKEHVFKTVKILLEVSNGR